jgi:Ca2+-binding RTX toxin-like protein
MAIINGTPGNDTLFGTAFDDTIAGGDGHDYLRAGSGNDDLSGGSGDDYLDGGTGDDRIDGGAGWDRIAFRDFGTLGGITVDLRIQDGTAQNTGQGFDILTGIEHASGTINSDTIIGNSGDNWLWGGSAGTGGPTGDDTISGLEGNDLIMVGSGNHSLNGGIGNDTLSLWGNYTDIGPAGVTVSLALQGAAQATEQGSMLLAGFENLSGSRYDDILAGDGAANVLAGDEGDDSLSGGAGADILYGDGRIIVDTHDTGTSGPITTYGDVAALLGGFVDGDDVLEGGEGDDSLWGGGGSDTASYAGAGAAVAVNLLGFASASGGAGEDVLHDIENVLGSAFDDQILGDDGANVLTGGDGHDYIRGRGGNDSLVGGNGDDYLGGGLGDDRLDGGAGWDRVAFFSEATGGVHVDLNIQGVAQNTGQGMDTLVGIEHASGTPFDDVLIGNGGDNWLWGENGNDSFSAGAGNDLVEAGPGNSVADGGAGIDTFSLWGNGAAIAGVTLSLALMGSAQASGIGSMTLTGFENLSGSNGDDALTGNGGANTLAGDQGDDVLSGGDGDDLLLGDGRIIIDSHGVGTSGPIVTYDDVAAALGDGDGDDILVGGKGNDILVGGGGDDVLTGSQGQDRFVFGPGSGDDRITDFATKDLIVLAGVAGVDDFGDLTLTASGKDTLVSWGTGDSILLEGVKPKQLSAADFAFDSAAPAAMAFETHDPGPAAGPHTGDWLP